MPKPGDDPYSDAALLEEVRLWLERVSQSLPDKIEVAALGVREKAPFKALAVREALIWRAEEFTRSAYRLLLTGDLAAAVLIIRGVVECAALMARLTQIVFERHNSTPEDLDSTLSRMLSGWKKHEGEFPDAINILTFVDHLDKRTPGVRRAYDLMSEIAHPNWSGVAGLFSRDDTKTFVTYFGRFPNKTQPITTHAILTLSASIALFESDYNNLGDLLPPWLAELQPLSLRCSSLR